MQKNNKLILFIHGLIGNKNSFGNFYRLIKNYTALKPYTTKVYEYPTGIFPLFSPKIQSLSNGLKSDIETKYSDYDEIILVCHSMGGLIAKMCILDEIESIKNHTSNITKLLLYAVPNIGSDLAYFRFHPQVSQLNRESDFLEFLNQGFKKNNISEYIDILYVIGAQDKIVNRTSASGFWEDNFREIENKSHFLCNGIAKPKNYQDKSFLLLKDFVLKKKAFITINQPHLSIEELSNTQEFQRLNYKSSYIPFLGRTKEIDDLNTFIKQNDPFLWWVIYEAGGSGKSRLAFKFANEMNSLGVRAGFYSLTSSFDWQNWNPAQPTLIIIDYAGSNPKQISEIISILTNRKSDFTHEVRLVLLERNLQYPNNWYDNLFDGSGNINRNSMYAEPLALSVLDDDDLFKIAKKFNSKLDMQKNDFIEHLENLDPKKRPLFSALLGEALSSSIDFKSLNREAIIKNYLHRTFSRYWRGITEDYFVLAAIITISSKLVKTELIIKDEEYFPKAANFDRNILEHILVDSTDEFYIALQPDMIGELFVLEYFNSNNQDFNNIGTPEHIKNRTKFILKYIWKHYPLDTVIFISRCVQDFVDHQSIKMLADISNIDVENRKIVSRWASMVMIVVFYYSNQRKIKEAQELLDKLHEVSMKYSKNKKIVLKVAKASSDLLTAVGEQGEMGKAQKLLDKLYAFSIQHANNGDIALVAAGASRNLIIHCNKQGKMKEAQKLLDKLYGLFAQDSENKDIALEFAKASFNLIIYYDEQGEMGKIQKLLDKLYELPVQYSDNSDIAINIAKASFNLIIYYDEQGEMGKIQKLLDKLCELPVQYSDNSKIAITIATVSSKLIIDYNEQGEMKEARKLLDKLYLFFFLNIDNKDISLASLIANISSILIIDYEKQGNMKEGRELLDKLYELSIQYPDNEEIVSIVAEASFDLISYYGMQGEMKEAQKLLKKLYVFSFQHSDNKEIVLKVAEASLNLISYYGMQGEMKEALELLNKLYASFVPYLDNKETVLRVTEASLNLISYYDKQGEMEEVQKLLDKLNELQIK